MLKLEDDIFADEFELGLSEFVLIADLGAAEPEFEVRMKHLSACFSGDVFFLCVVGLQFDFVFLFGSIQCFHGVIVPLLEVGQDAGLKKLSHFVNGRDRVYNVFACGIFLRLEDQPLQVGRTVVLDINEVAFSHPFFPQHCSCLQQFIIFLL